jgi:predicted O-methyltransferase YrrM
MISNILRNALRPRWGREMARKLWIRWRERGMARAREDSVAWCRANQIDAEPWARSLDGALWQEARSFADEQSGLADAKSKEMGIPIGGAGFYALLYFLTRLLKPDTIAETGVAFGFSSRAFLRGLEVNGRGRLLSSDFPYFRQADPERLIGILVEPELRHRWRLLVGSDRDNLPEISASADRIDLLHYDSDKSVSGRAFALNTLSPRLSADALVVFDDVQDNLHFRDWILADGRNHRVFEFQGKWIGLTGGPPRLYEDAAQG